MLLPNSLISYYYTFSFIFVFDTIHFLTLNSNCGSLLLLLSYYTYTLIVAAWLFGFHFQLLWIVSGHCCLFYLENPSIDRCCRGCSIPFQLQGCGYSTELKRSGGPLHFFFFFNFFLMHFCYTQTSSTQRQYHFCCYLQHSCFFSPHCSSHVAHSYG